MTHYNDLQTHLDPYEITPETAAKVRQLLAKQPDAELLAAVLGVSS